MKKFICAISGLLLFSSDPGAAQGQKADVERNVAVELEKHPSRLFECSRAVATYYSAQKGEGTASFEFRVQMNGDDIRYNSYRASQNGLNVGGVCLQENGETGVWAIVIDDSDPKGRAKTIGYEVTKAAQLVAGMPPGAKVGVYSLARELKLLGASAGENNGWRSAVGIPRPVVPGCGEESVKSVLDCFPELNKEKKVLNSSPRNNTNLWSGLLTLVERELPNQLTGGFAHLPANIVLLSDGVDESGRSGDLEKLAQAAASAGVRIHTIAYPHKDIKGKDEGALMKPDLYLGYHSLSDLSRMTKGVYCATGYNKNDKGGIDLVEEGAWVNILPQGKIRLLELSVPYGEIYENRAFKLQLFNGKEMECAFSIPSNEMARVIGSVVIRRLKTTSDFLKNKPLLDKDGVKPSDFIELGQWLQKLCALDGVEGILEEAVEDKGFKERLGKIISHAKAHPELMKEPTATFLAELGLFLCSGNPPLSSPPAANAQAQPTVVNVNAPASGTESEENDREVVLDWVWWCLGGGGAALCLLGFWCVARLMGRAPQAPAVTVLTGETDLSGPTQPVLASLVNVGNRSQSWVVCKTPCSVGRHSRNDISLPFTYVSGTQFFLSRDAAGQWELKDANSTNGTMVNGRKVSACPLNSGDVIRVADLELEFKVR